MTTMSSENEQRAKRLRETSSVDADNWEHITAELARRAEAEDLIDVAFERHDTPLGPIVLAATRQGLVRVGLPAEREDAILDELAARISARILRAPRRTVTQARRELDEYFEHRRTCFDVPLDWQLTTGFRRRVLDAATEIRYGQTASYADVAARAGSPRAVRAAGSSLANNPLPIVVPCHRVIRSSGDLGAYRGGPEAKARLISLESRQAWAAAGRFMRARSDL
jgi:methylated-DNA-[protein]-cysteine S-methyltransferase